MIESPRFTTDASSIFHHVSLAYAMKIGKLTLFSPSSLFMFENYRTNPNRTMRKISIQAFALKN